MERGPTGEHTAILGLGANLGDPERQLVEALRRIGRVLSLDAISSVYRTEPVGFRDQPDFLNLVCAGRTALEPAPLLDALRAIEETLGRVRSHRDAPRLIDIDILAFDDRVHADSRLVIPHPRLHERAFVLAPLAEILPQWRHPALHRTAAGMLAALADPPRVEWWSPAPPAAP